MAQMPASIAKSSMKIAVHLWMAAAKTDKRLRDKKLSGILWNAS